jgi:hypothetical protein
VDFRSAKACLCDYMKCKGFESQLFKFYEKPHQQADALQFRVFYQALYATACLRVAGVTFEISDLIFEAIYSIK